MYRNLFNSSPIIGYSDHFEVFAATNYTVMKVCSHIFDYLSNFLSIGSEEREWQGQKVQTF